MKSPCLASTKPHLVREKGEDEKQEPKLSERSIRYLNRNKFSVLPRYLTDLPDHKKITLNEPPKVREEEEKYFPELMTLECMGIEDWKEEQSKDPTLKRIIFLLTHPTSSDTVMMNESPEVIAYLHQKSDLKLVEGVLVKEIHVPKEKQILLGEGKGYDNCNHICTYLCKVIPKHMTLGLFKIWHERPEGGHFCYKRIYPLIKRRFFWIGMARNVQDWTRACPSCQKTKGLGKHATKMPLKQTLASRPFERVAVDVMGPWNMTASGNRFVIIYQDYFSKWIEIFATRRHTADVVANILVNEIVSRYGVMDYLHSDQGPEFESALYQQMCRLLGINKTRTCSYTPWSNGLLERGNRTVKGMVKHYVDSSQNTWDRFLHYLRFAYNSTVHDSTGFTPFRLFFSRCCDPVVPLDLVYGNPNESQRFTCQHLYCMEQKEQSEKVFDIARQHLKCAAQSQRQAQGRTVSISYEPGELVIQEYPPIANTKLGPKYTGPYVVSRMIGSHNVEICKNGSPKVIHINNLKPWKEQSLY